MTVAGTVTNGVIVLDQAGTLPEGAHVEVIVTEPGAASARKPTLAGLVRLAGCLDDLPADFAAEHDHYIHGTPKRSATEG